MDSVLSSGQNEQVVGSSGRKAPESIEDNQDELEESHQRLLFGGNTSTTSESTLDSGLISSATKSRQFSTARARHFCRSQSRSHLGNSSSSNEIGWQIEPGDLRIESFTCNCKNRSCRNISAPTIERRQYCSIWPPLERYGQNCNTAYGRRNASAPDSNRPSPE